LARIDLVITSLRPKNSVEITTKIILLAAPIAIELISAHLQVLTDCNSLYTGTASAIVAGVRKKLICLAPRLYSSKLTPNTNSTAIISNDAVRRGFKSGNLWRR
jgi:hypothetical protein